MAGSIDQIDLISFAIFGFVVHGDGMGFDGDASFPFEIHGIEDLRLHIARGNGMRELQEAIGDCRLAMVDVGNDRKIADFFYDYI